jgi:hypothetical protein
MLEKAFKLFTKYAQRVEKDTKGAELCSLRIYDDESGSIEDKLIGKVYMEFEDFEDLVRQLEQKKAVL